jgi:hypothetical protein
MFIRRSSIKKSFYLNERKFIIFGYVFEKIGHVSITCCAYNAHNSSFWLGSLDGSIQNYKLVVFDPFDHVFSINWGETTH